jgi:hypothetical protein
MTELLAVVTLAKRWEEPFKITEGATERELVVDKRVC